MQISKPAESLGSKLDLRYNQLGKSLITSSDSWAIALLQATEFMNF